MSFDRFVQSSVRWFNVAGVGESASAH